MNGWLRRLTRQDDEDHRIVHEIEAMIRILGVDPDLEDSRLVEALIQTGIGRRRAERLTILVPIAFGRDLVTQLGVRTDPNIEVDRANGSRRRVRLDTFREFRVAREVSERIRNSEQFVRLATRSAEYNAAHALLDAPGRDITDLTGARLTATLVTWDII